MDWIVWIVWESNDVEIGLFTHNNLRDPNWMTIVHEWNVKEKMEQRKEEWFVLKISEVLQVGPKCIDWTDFLGSS